MIYERRYLLWKKGQRTFILKHYDYYDIDKKSKGKRVQVSEFKDSLDLFCFLRDNFHAVVSDTLLPAKLRYVIDNKEIVADYGILHSSDDGYTQISILSHGKIYHNGYIGNDLNDGIIRNTDGTFREKQESLNYQTNIHKAIYTLIEKIEKQVALLNLN